MGKSDLQDLLKLTLAERIELAERLWESVAVEAESLPPTVQEIAFAKQRLAEHRADPDDVVPWAEVRKDLGL